MTNYFNELKEVVRRNFDSKISDVALDSIVKEALESLPIINSNIPFSVNEEEYIKSELMKQVNNIIVSIMKNTPFGTEEIAQNMVDAMVNSSDNTSYEENNSITR